jgi:hypothetical protein
MSTRRDALRIFGVASTIVPALAAVQQTQETSGQPGHLHSGPAIKVPVPSEPTFLQPAEFLTVEALSERIIPRTETPGAKEAGAALLIDKAIVAEPPLGPVYRAGIADLNALATSSYGKPFTELTEEQQIVLLTPLSLDQSSSLGKFFATVKDMTVDAYYKTEAGLKTELGWHGNTFLAEFPGCDHPGNHS